MNKAVPAALSDICVTEFSLERWIRLCEGAVFVSVSGPRSKVKGVHNRTCSQQRENLPSP